MTQPSARESFQLHGLYVITGGTRGIGRAISLQFARAGARVIAGFLRDEEAAHELQSAAQTRALPVSCCRADLTTAAGLDRLVAAVKETGIPVAGVVHCAATGTHRPVEALTGKHLEWTFALNVRALFDLLGRLLPLLDRPASLLAVSSLGATHALPHYTAVGASKGALEALVRHLAVELAPRGVRANLLRPGAVSTDAWRAIPDAEMRLAEAARRSPLGRLVTADELASCAQFLCSPAASGINGQTLTVDGGASIVA